MSEFFGEQSHNSDWAAGYDAGNAMMLKAVATAELLERKRIIKLLETTPFERSKSISKDWLKGANWMAQEIIALIKEKK